jgi:very-short-patch-repair endonuclease
MPLLDPHRADRGHVSVVDALAMAARCLPPRLALAAFDSATHLGLVTPSELERIASSLPLDGQRILLRMDGRSESGLETILRDVLVELGFRVVLQPKFPGIGRPDLVVEDWVIVEADGDAYHDAKVTSRDRRRDAAFTATKRTVLHFRYSQIMYELGSVVEAVIAAVEVHRHVRDSGSIAARARRRLKKVDLS